MIMKVIMKIVMEIVLMLNKFEKVLKHYLIKNGNFSMFLDSYN